MLPLILKKSSMQFFNGKVDRYAASATEIAELDEGVASVAIILEWCATRRSRSFRRLVSRVASAAFNLERCQGAPAHFLEKLSILPKMRPLQQLQEQLLSLRLCRRRRELRRVSQGAERGPQQWPVHSAPFCGCCHSCRSSLTSST